jgi:hypothetical protein
MKSVYRFALMLCVGGVMIALAGCNKIIEYLGDNPTAEYTACKIKKMTWDGDFSPLSFTYNSHGDPATITPGVSTTGMPKHVFKYDSKKRLTEYRKLYNNGYFESWIRYVYNSQGRVIRDTIWSMGTVNGENPANEYDKAVTTYSYDPQGRISNTYFQSITVPMAPASDIDYDYDSRGNLIVPGAVYDDKINYRRTNRILMFIDRDYSVNNIKPVGTYNAQHLPVKSVPNTITHSFLHLDIDKFVEIEYKCN